MLIGCHFVQADVLDKKAVAGEFADVFYFALVCHAQHIILAFLMWFPFSAQVAAARAGVSLTDLENVLDRRALAITRRPGNAKKAFENQIAQRDQAATLAPPPSSSASPSSALPILPTNSRDSGLLSRKTAETEIEARVVLDGEGRGDVATGIGFLDHMVSALAKHSRFDITLHAKVH